jgi:hypothetical protein
MRIIATRAGCRHSGRRCVSDTPDKRTGRGMNTGCFNFNENVFASPVGRACPEGAGEGSYPRGAANQLAALGPAARGPQKGPQEGTEVIKLPRFKHSKKWDGKRDG